MARLRIGSRGSQLALWQSNYIANLLGERGHEVAIVIVKTIGDQTLDIPLIQVGSKGMFTKELEEALANDVVDLAVHSLKDLPTELAPEFEIAAIPKREDARDAFCSIRWKTIHDLPPQARVGTGSLRRQAQILALRPDLATLPIRGNVDTRLRKLEAGEYDAIILAVAGLNRLDKTSCIRQIIPADVMCPAAGQGALAIEIRAADVATRGHVAFLDNRSARMATTCERALLQRLGGGCQVPIGAFAELRAGRLHLSAVVARPDGGEILRESGAGKDPTQLGDSVGATLLRRGGLRLIHYRGTSDSAQIPDTWKSSAAPIFASLAPLAGLRILVGRARHQADALSSQLRLRGAEVIEIPFIEIRKPDSYKPLDSALKKISTYDWLILTSVNGVDALSQRLQHLQISTARLCHLKIAAIGPATRKALEDLGLKVAVVPRKYIAESVVKSLQNKIEGKRVLLARAKVARDVIPRELRKRGAKLDVVEAYQTVIPRSSRVQLRAVLQGGRRPDIITFTSSSMAKNFVQLMGKNFSGRRTADSRINDTFPGIRMASIGPVTSATSRDLGLTVHFEASEYTIPGLIHAIENQ